MWPCQNSWPEHTIIDRAREHQHSRKWDSHSQPFNYLRAAKLWHQQIKYHDSRRDSFADQDGLQTPAGLTDDRIALLLKDFPQQTTHGVMVIRQDNPSMTCYRTHFNSSPGVDSDLILNGRYR